MPWTVSRKYNKYTTQIKQINNTNTTNTLHKYNQHKYKLKTEEQTSQSLQLDFLHGLLPANTTNTHKKYNKYTTQIHYTNTTNTQIQIEDWRTNLAELTVSRGENSLQSNKHKKCINTQKQLILKYTNTRLIELPLIATIHNQQMKQISEIDVGQICELLCRQ